MSDSHAELSRELALTLGYYPESVRVKYEGTSSAYCQVYRLCRHTKSEPPYWQAIDYRSPYVCLPLIKWLITAHDASLGDDSDGNPFRVWFRSAHGFSSTDADTLEEAVARAVIAVRRG